MPSGAIPRSLWILAYPVDQAVHLSSLAPLSRGTRGPRSARVTRRTASWLTDTIDRRFEPENTGNLRGAARYSIVMVSWKTTSTTLAAEARDYWPRLKIIPSSRPAIMRGDAIDDCDSRGRTRSASVRSGWSLLLSILDITLLRSIAHSASSISPPVPLVMRGCSALTRHLGCGCCQPCDLSRRFDGATGFEVAPYKRLEQSRMMNRFSDTTVYRVSMNCIARVCEEVEDE